MSESLIKILLAPHITEKSTSIMQEDFYTFKVRKDATKRDIASAVEALFKVKVELVRTLNVKGKRKYFRRVAGRQKAWKKAYVKLQQGQMIDFSNTKTKVE